MKQLKQNLRKNLILILLCLTVTLCTACTDKKTTQWNTADHTISQSLTYDHSMKLSYATEYVVDYYNDGFILISISDGSRYLLNTGNGSIPEDLDSQIIILAFPVNHIYLVASATMDMFAAADAIENICLSGLKKEDWHIDAAKVAMEQGLIQYAGKYNAPDYERILSEGCELTIESTMILHSPDVKEKLESFGIPVLIDRSSYEAHPLGRTEWVKLYGILTGHEEQAMEAFQEQSERYDRLGMIDKTGKTVVFFYITSNETVVVRKTNDYVAKMIELAGGTYLFQDLQGEENASSSVNMQLEEFYAKAKDADYLVYNSTIDGEIRTTDDLLQKCSLLKDFKAVQNQNVWCTTQNVYQKSMSAGSMIEEFHAMLISEDAASEQTDYIYQLE